METAHNIRDAMNRYKLRRRQRHAFKLTWGHFAVYSQCYRPTDWL